jgi:hypothetical protein
MENKVLYYSWFSDMDDRPELVKNCMETWGKYLPGFKVVNMNQEFIESNNIKSPYLDKALEYKMYSHAADYLRFWSMYNKGGLYLDSDVEILGDISDLFELSIYIGREGHKSSVPDNLEAAILYFRSPNNTILSNLLHKYDNLDLISMTYKEFKLNTAPRMMKSVGFEVTSISHPNLIHRFNNTWFDYDVWNKDELDFSNVNIDPKWNFVNELTRSTRYVITNKRMNFGEYHNLSIEEYGFEGIKNKLEV